MRNLASLRWLAAACIMAAGIEVAQLVRGAPPAVSSQVERRYAALDRSLTDDQLARYAALIAPVYTEHRPNAVALTKSQALAAMQARLKGLREIHATHRILRMSVYHAKATALVALTLSGRRISAKSHRRQISWSERCRDTWAPARGGYQLIYRIVVPAHTSSGGSRGAPRVGAVP